MSTIRLMAIDDHPAITGWISSICEKEEDLQFVGSYGSIEAVPIPERSDVDVIVLDLLLDEGGLLDGLEQVVTWGPSVIVLSVSDSGTVVDRALRIGASAFVGKRATDQQMIDAVRRVMEGEAGFTIRVDRPVALPNSLSHHLSRVLEELKHSTDTKTLSIRLNLAPHTVDVYVNQLYDILGTTPRNRAALANQAAKLGF